MSQRQIGVLVFLVASFSGLSAPVVAAPAPNDLLAPIDNPVTPPDGGNPMDALPNRESRKLAYLVRVNEIRQAVHSRMSGTGSKSAPIEFFGSPGSEVSRFSMSGYTVMATEFKESIEMANSPGEAFFYRSPSVLGMEFSTEAGRIGVSMGIGNYSIVVRDGVVESYDILSVDTVLYHRVGSALISTLLTSGVNGESVGATLGDLMSYQSITEKFIEFAAQAKDLREFVEKTLPVFIDRLETTNIPARKQGGQGSGSVHDKDGIADTVCFAGTGAFLFTCGIPPFTVLAPECVAAATAAFSACLYAAEPFFNPPPPAPANDCHFDHFLENGDAVFICSAPVSPTEAIQP